LSGRKTVFAESLLLNIPVKLSAFCFIFVGFPDSNLGLRTGYTDREVLLTSSRPILL